MGHIVLIRHGETEWSRAHRHTSVTDLDLTATGEEQARGVSRSFRHRSFRAVLSSPRLRALRTADLVGLEVSRVDDDLAEWWYGEYEGLTTEEIRRRRPGWTLWSDGAPGGESPEEVARRADRVLSRVRPLLDVGDVAIIGHGHALRVLAARWIGWPPSAGAVLALNTSTVSELGFEHEWRCIRRWNVTVSDR